MVRLGLAVLCSAPNALCVAVHPQNNDHQETEFRNEEGALSPWSPLHSSHRDDTTYRLSSERTDGQRSL